MRTSVLLGVGTARRVTPVVARRGYTTGGSPFGATPPVVMGLIGANVGVWCLWQYLGPTFMVRNVAVSAVAIASALCDWGRYRLGAV